MAGHGRVSTLYESLFEITIPGDRSAAELPFGGGDGHRNSLRINASWFSYVQMQVRGSAFSKNLYILVRDPPHGLSEAWRVMVVFPHCMSHFSKSPYKVTDPPRGRPYGGGGVHPIGMMEIVPLAIFNVIM